MLRSWDRFEIPHLFSRAIYYYGEPITIPRELSPDEAEGYRQRIQAELNRLCDELERDFDRLYDSA